MQQQYLEKPAQYYMEYIQTTDTEYTFSSSDLLTTITDKLTKKRNNSIPYIMLILTYYDDIANIQFMNLVLK